MSGIQNLKNYQLNCKGKILDFGRCPLIMGILNVTPDSFSDGGQYDDENVAIRHALDMEQEGADIIDIGGESTRPGASEISADQEMDRILPVIESLSHQLKIPISVDTRRADVATEAVKAGASLVNDISGLLYDTLMAETIAALDVPVVIMHSRDDPSVMQTRVDYDNIISDICIHLSKCVINALSAGVRQNNIIIDPGIGFGKTVEQNLSIIKHLNRFFEMGYPVLIGVSRKSFIGKTLNLPESDRLMGTAAAVAACALKGIHIVRVHDVLQMKQVVTIIKSIKKAE